MIENKKISDLKEEDGFIRTTIELVSDLLMSQEYSLQITLDTDKGRPITIQGLFPARI